MGTRAAAFTAKIRNLQDYHSRLTNGVMPLPTGPDLANALKHFSQTLLAILKDVPQFPLEMCKSRSEDSARLQLFPILDYKALYTVVVQLIDVTPAITFGVQVFGQSILHTIACLLPFLEHEQIDTLPYLVASSLGTFPASLHKEIVDLMCYYLFPFTIFKTEESPEKALYATEAVSAVLMMVFQYTTSSEYHCQILESVMKYKRDAIKDLLCVVAYGSVEARNVAINLLVYYWPHHNPTLYDRRNITFKYTGRWKVPSCRSEMCSVHNTGGLADATKVCFDHSIGISLSPENPPPLFLCQECASRLQSEQPSAIEHLYDVSLPISRTGNTCDNKNCRSQGPEKIMNGVVCFNSECAVYNGNRPIRYCSQCHAIRHNNRRGADHVFHLAVQPANYNEPDLLNYHVEAIVSLLLEAEPMSTRGGSAKEDQQARLRLFTEGEFTDPIPIEERRLMGRFAIWLLCGFFSPEEEMPKEILSRLLSALFQWFNTTAYLGDDPSASTLERLKTDVVCPWLKKVIKHNFDTFVTCLLPHPPDYARVGGHWDVISSRTYHLREGFNRLFCLVPYEVISPEIWSQIMPNWMEAMASEVPEEEMGELKSILSKVMDPEMNPLGFDARQMYQFIAVRFNQTSHKVKEQALRWLQVLSKLEIVIPLYFIFSIFREGIRPKSEKVPKRGSVSTQEGKEIIAAICQDESPDASSLSDDDENFALHTDKQTESELMLSSFIFMLDIILKQLALQEVEQHKGLQSLVAKDAMALLHNMVAMPWPGVHTCQDGQECQFCEMAVLWYQLALEVVEKLAPTNAAIPPDIMLSPDGEFGSRMFPEVSQKLEVKPETKPSISPKSETVGMGMGLEGIIVNMPQILTATVETCADLDLAPIIPSEKVVRAVAKAVTITETETAQATAQVTASANLVGDEVSGAEEGGELNKDFWVTSVGKFKFRIEDLPPYLQFTFELLKKIPNIEDPEIMQHLLKCLKIMFLHEEVLQKAAKEHRGFVIWCQENLLVRNLWELMEAENSQLCEHAVPVLLHCLTLPVGADVFWKQVEEDFQSPDWRRRFNAIERVVTITRFMDFYPVRASQVLQTGLANAFCYTISSLDDPHVSVAQRSALFLGTINDSAMQSLMYCLESQFDSVIIDRPVILQSLYLLINSVSDRKILRWDFFLNCFDTLYIEAQLLLERIGELSFAKDVRNIETNFEHFLKKLGRVQDSINKIDGSAGHGHKTLYSSLGTKWPYKRTMSAPAGLHRSDMDRHYSRQSSAPVLKRKGSRHGIDGVIHGLLAGEDSHLVPIFSRVVDMIEGDKETIHLLIFLFMQFLSRYSRGPVPSDNKALAKTQNAVLRHVTMLLGYNPQEKSFFITPSRLRSSPIFNSFMANLPQVLDQNLRVGGVILPISFTVLHYCPAPSKTSGSRMHPSFTIWLLEPHVRRHWLIALIVILYKYEYGMLPLSSQVQTVIKIVLNTLNAQEHRCRPLPSTLIVDEPTTRSRELSRGNLANAGDLEHITEHETPPMTPLSGHNISPTSLQKEHRKSVGSITSSKAAKKPTTPTQGATDSFEFASSQDQDDGDEVEPELAAIPESPKSTGSGEIQALQVLQPSVHQTEFQTLDQLQQVTVHSESPKLVDTGPLSASSDKSRSWFGSGDGDSKSSSSGASTSSKSPLQAKTDFPWHLSVQAAFQIAKIPAPPLERLLPVGPVPPPLSPTVKPQGRTADYASYESAEDSSMARLDMISLGPQVRVDETTGERAVRDEAKVFRMEEYSKALHRTDSYGRCISPKKLVKQPHVLDGETASDAPGFKPQVVEELKHAVDSSKSVGFVPGFDMSHSHSRPPLHNVRQSSLRIGDDCVQYRCGECGVVLENYTNEELGLCLVALETFIHREPGLAAPLMPEILKIVTRVALRPLFAWQAETTSYYPGGVCSVAHQFLRCVLHQLSSYGVFVQLFQTKFSDRVKQDVFKSISLSLTDFTELNPVAPLQMLLEALNARKALFMDTVAPIIDNVAVYMECLPLEAASVTWSSVIPLFEAFLRKILPVLLNEAGVEGILRTMACLLRLPGIVAFKSILDPFSKILSFALGNVAMKYQMISELCYLCHRGFLREREKQYLTRVTVVELVNALKFKTNIPDANFLMLVTFILQDAGGSLAPYVYLEGFPKFVGGAENPSAPTTGATECMRQHLTDAIEFLADFHSLSKIKSNYKGNGCGLNDDTLGGVIKGGISQFIALEISRGNSRENRAIARHLPWLYNAPSAMQQGPKEFLDCVAHIRVLSWLLLGSLTHAAMYGPHATAACAPIPLEASCHVADHVHVIMTGFAEQSKGSVLHMSSLFHAFILCQVWTIYLEQVGPIAQMSTSNDPANVASNILTDFWGKVTPAILQLISHSKVLAEMVNLHFLTLLESLLECNSSVFNRLLPLWSPVLYAHSGQLPAHVQVRLQACLGYPPPNLGKKESSSEQPGGIEFPSPHCGPVHNLLLLKWVQRLQFKMAQIELQSSAATQFYPL